MKRSTALLALSGAAFVYAVAAMPVPALAQAGIQAGLTVGSLKRVSPVLAAERRQENFEPALVHADQQAEAVAKLKRLRERKGRPPNIIYLVVDDLGYGDVGAYGGGELLGAPTPNVDRLAREGLKLTSTYAQPTCSPTRAALMTGRLPVRSGLIRPSLLNDTSDVSSEILSARLLSQAGYRTALSGKWHLGEKEGSRPWQVGYDEFEGFLGVINAYQEEHPVDTDVVHDPELLEQLRSMPGSRDLWKATAKDGGRSLGKINWQNSRDLDQKFAEFSEDFIRRSVREGKPFFLNHNFAKVHYFNNPSKAFEGRSATKDVYRDSVIEVDDIVGRLVRLLEELQIADNTPPVSRSRRGSKKRPLISLPAERCCRACQDNSLETVSPRYTNLRGWAGTAAQMTDSMRLLARLEAVAAHRSIGQERLGFVSEARFDD